MSKASTPPTAAPSIQGVQTAALAASDPRVASVLRRLELDVSRRLDGLLHGDHRGLVPGHGSEPGEARAYSPGDDVRRIDWNVTARSTVPHIRETVADRELECWLLVDCSPSMNFGTAEQSKADLVLAASGAVSLLTARGGNRLGAMIAGAGGATIIPARQGRTHTLAVLSRIATTQTADGQAAPLGEALVRLRAVARRRGLIVVISDFLDDPATWKLQLSALSSRHDLLAIEIVDPREMELPDAGVLTLIDTETGRLREINTSRRSVRDRYATEARTQRRLVAESIRGAGADHLQLRTDEDWLGLLAQHVGGRRRRRANTNVVGGRR